MKLARDVPNACPAADFTGTGGQRDDNFNAPPSVTRAALIGIRWGGAFLLVVENFGTFADAIARKLIAEGPFSINSAIKAPVPTGAFFFGASG